MTEEDRWAKVRQIVREENERLEARILGAIGKAKNKVELVNGQWVGITEQLKQAWSSAYPAVEIEAELKKAAAWIMSNPTMAPRSQFTRFLLTWFARTQDRTAIRSIPTPSERTAIAGPGKKLCAYCDHVASGSVNGRWHCNEHANDAMDLKPIPMFKNPVTAKNVTGER